MWCIIYRFSWLGRKQKVTVYPINENSNKCFQYAVTVALNQKGIRKHSETKTKVKPFINKYYWEGKYFASEKDDWKKIEKNNLTIALNVLYAKKYISCLRFKT